MRNDLAAAPAVRVSLCEALSAGLGSESQSGATHDSDPVLRKSKIAFGLTWRLG